MPISKVQSKSTQSNIAHNKKSRNQATFPFEKLVEHASPEGVEAVSHTEEQKELQGIYTFDSIEEAAERLKHVPTLENALKFRATVSAFLRIVVAERLELEHHQSGASLLTRRKKYLLIVEIQSNLDKLVESMQSSYHDAFSFLERIHKITGMLVDLKY